MSIEHEHPKTLGNIMVGKCAIVLKCVNGSHISY